MKKIGFVDYYLSEWHANNYPEWIAEVCSALKVDYEVAYGWAEMDISLVDGVSTDDWCKKMKVEKCDTIEELCEKSDAIIILSPSNPEKHLSYAEKVLPFGKPTYIDKTFAPDKETASRIFELSEKYGARFFSTSALRYADELSDFNEVNNLVISGGGSNLPEYIIHIVEMAVILLNDSVKSVVEEREGNKCIFNIVSNNNKKAKLVYSPEQPFYISGVKQDGTIIERSIESDFFKGLIKEIINFFEGGIQPFDSNQTISVMQLRDAIISADNNFELKK